MFQKNDVSSLNNSVENEVIVIIYGTQNPDDQVRCDWMNVSSGTGSLG